MERVIDNPENEILDVVDYNDVVIRQINRSESNLNPNEYLRVVNCFVINSLGKIWVPTRSQNKRKFPGAIDFSAAGYVQSGETYDAAMISEISEELNINVTNTQLILLGKLKPSPTNLRPLSSIMNVYAILVNNPIQYNSEDFDSAEWMTPNELRHKILSGTAAKPDIIAVLDSLHAAIRQTILLNIES